MQSRWCAAVLFLAIWAGCGGSNESAPAANLPSGLPAPPEGQAARTPGMKRYPAYTWPPDFQLPLDIEIVTEEVPPEIQGPSKLNR
jgi:hypothetical protein